MSSSTPADRGLPTYKRLVTTHNKDGKAVFASNIPEPIPYVDAPGGAQFSLVYSTDSTKPDFTNDKDMKEYENHMPNYPGIFIPGGTTVRYIDVPPGGGSPMHRTVSMDYGIVLDGEVECTLDSGEVRRMKKGDFIVQRGTMHQWRNPSATEWYRMLFIMLESEKVEIDGKKLDEEGVNVK